MRRLLKALERAGLVETDFEGPDHSVLERTQAQADSEAALSQRVDEPVVRPQQRPSPVAARPSAPAAAASAPASAGEGAAPDALIEARPFEDIYAEHELAASPFPAERLLRVLDGLNALEPVARKTAVIALDSADDSWTVDDSLLDAERKIRVLEAYRSRVEEQTRALLAEGKAALEAREQLHAETAQRIRQQIQDLEGLLERDVARVGQEKAEIHATARANKEACARETARIDQEVERLRRIAEIFDPPTPTPGV